MNIPRDLLYAKTHEWIKKNDDGSAYVGITDFAQAQLGDLVYVDLPNVGDEVIAGESFGDVESVKAVSDVISPVSAKIDEVNEELLDAPGKINEAPYEAWLIKVSGISGEDELMTPKEYEEFTAD